MSKSILLGSVLGLLLAGCTARAEQTPAATASALTEQKDAMPTTMPTELPTMSPIAEPTAAVAAVVTATVEAAAAVTPTVPPGMYVNPVYDRDFPDPDVLFEGDAYYAYATNSDGIHVQVARSADLVHWESLPDALPQLPAWAVQDFGWTWAPEVFRPAPDGPYVMYYTTRLAIGQGGIQCIGLATAQDPEGPFTPQGDEPVVCQQDEGGSIDPSTFRDDDGKLYLLWKNDGNSRGGQTWLYIRPLAADGLSLTGEPTRLLSVDKTWEGVLVEAPTLWKHDSRYHLFYSANDYASPRYAAGHGVAGALLGPYNKDPQPFLRTNPAAGIVGPGGQDIVTGPKGDTWIQRAEVGEDAAFGVSIGYPGFHAWFDLFAGGIMDLSVWYHEKPGSIQALAELHDRQATVQMEMILDEKPDFVLLGGSGTLTLQSPRIAQQLSLPTIQKLTRMAKQAGVPTMLHSCGKERALVRWCAEETDLDCINPLEIAPMGDCDLAEVKQCHGGRLALMGNLHTTGTMLYGTPEDVERAAVAAIDAAGANGGFILSTGDQCGRDTPDENLFRLIEVAKTYGRYA